MPRLHSLHLGMEDVNRPVAKMFWSVCCSTRMMENLRPGVVSLSVCVCVSGEEVGKERRQANKHSHTDSSIPARASLCGNGLHLQHASHSNAHAYSRCASPHFKQSISQQQLIATLASWATAGCLELAQSAAGS